MIRLLIICLLASIGYVPCSLAYNIVDAPPVERRAKKKDRLKKKKLRKKKTRQTKKVKTSTVFFFLSTLCSLVSILSSVFIWVLGGALIGYVCMVGFLVLAILFLIFGLVEKNKEKKGSGNSNESTLGNSSGE